MRQNKSTPSTNNSRVRKQVEMTVTSFDSQGEQMRSGGREWICDIEGSEGERNGQSLEVKDLGEGRYTASHSFSLDDTDKVGESYLSALVQGSRHLQQSSPFSFVVCSPPRRRDFVFTGIIQHHEIEVGGHHCFTVCGAKRGHTIDRGGTGSIISAVVSLNKGDKLGSLWWNGCFSSRSFASSGG